MANPENAKLLAEERALSDAEAAVAQTEMAAWARLESLDGADLGGAAQAALSRVEALEAAGAASADFAKIRAALQGILAAGAPAAAQRAAAVAQRQAATQARSAAAAALNAALAQVEPGKAARKRDVDSIETYLGKLEAAVKARQAGGTQTAAQPVPPRGRG